MGHTRPRTRLTKKLRERRCGKCGCLLNPKAIRCKRCAEPSQRPRT